MTQKIPRMCKRKYYADSRTNTILERLVIYLVKKKIQGKPRENPGKTSENPGETPEGGGGRRGGGLQLRGRDLIM